MEAYEKIKKNLAVAFMNDLDNNRPEGKMCLSNGECADIEKAFNEQDWPKLARYLDKYTESEDEIHRKWILEYLYDGFRKADEQFKDHFKSAINWLEKQKEQKPAEWSEEDELHRKSIISTIEMCIKDNERAEAVIGCYYSDIDWLKSLRPQPKAKLTLLDENIINAAVAFVEQNDHFNCWRGIDKHTVIKALCSLKPHWKPSEKQMNCLCAAVDAAIRKHNESVSGYEPARVLKSLYEDLQKL